MAATKIHRYLGRQTSGDFTDPFDLELDEADVWATGDKLARPDPRPPSSTPRPLRTPARKPPDVGARSLPMNVPDWSKLLGDEYAPRARAGDWAADDDSDEGEARNDRMPPHVYLAATRAASMSVHEGIGRTLKGRDLSRVRNAIWKRTGFED